MSGKFTGLEAKSVWPVVINTGQFEAVSAIQHCVDDIRNRMTNDKQQLPLNDDNWTEFLMIGTKKQLAKGNVDRILIGDCVIRPKG